MVSSASVLMDPEFKAILAEINARNLPMGELLEEKLAPLQLKISESPGQLMGAVTRNYKQSSFGIKPVNYLLETTLYAGIITPETRFVTERPSLLENPFSFAFISGIAYGACIICNKKLIMVFKPLNLMVYQYAGFVVWIPFIKANEYAIPQKAAILTVVYILFISLLPTFIYLTGLKHVKGQHIGIISYAEVIAVIIYGFLFFKETPTLLTLIGGALILFSGYMVIRAEAKIQEK